MLASLLEEQDTRPLNYSNKTLDHMMFRHMSVTAFQNKSHNRSMLQNKWLCYQLKLPDFPIAIAKVGCKALSPKMIAQFYPVQTPTAVHGLQAKG